MSTSTQYAGVIPVNLDNPLNHREVSAIHYKAELLIGQHLQNVVCIDLDDLDLRDVLSEGYQIKLLKDRPNCLEISVPICGYSRRTKVESGRIKDVEIVLDRHNARIQKVMDVTRNRIGRNDKEVLLVRFPDDMVLTNEHYSPALINGVVNYTMVPMEADHMLDSTITFWITMTRVTWMLTTVQTTPLVVNIPEEPAAVEKLAAQMAGMMSVRGRH